MTVPKKIQPIRHRNMISISENNMHDEANYLQFWAKWPSTTIDPDASDSLSNRDTITLHNLLIRLRKRKNSLPLTILIHGWGYFSTYEFYRMLLLSRLDERDSLWLVLTKSNVEPLPPSTRQGTIVLNLDRPTDNRIYNNINCDLVFFPALTAQEDDLLARFFKTYTHSSDRQARSTF